jgi:glycopeptide antibiotics resistance protein
MNWGIFTLMAVIVTVLATIAGFFIYIIRRETALAAKAAVENPSEVKV